VAVEGLLQVARARGGGGHEDAILGEQAGERLTGDRVVVDQNDLDPGGMLAFEALLPTRYVSSTRQMLLPKVCTPGFPEANPIAPNL
jgi:hypothetical protein